MNPLNPKTAADQVNCSEACGQSKYFLVSRVIKPERLIEPIERVRIEVVF